MLGAETRRHLQHHVAYTYLAARLDCMVYCVHHTWPDPAGPVSEALASQRVPLMLQGWTVPAGRPQPAVQQPAAPQRSLQHQQGLDVPHLHLQRSGHWKIVTGNHLQDAGDISTQSET